MTQNGDIYAICCGPEVVGEVISGRHARTIECYVVANFEVATLRLIVSDILKHFMTAKADIDDSIMRNTYSTVSHKNYKAFRDRNK